MAIMKERFNFTNSESEREYTSKSPISEQAKKNTLFAERLKVLDELKHFSDIPRTLLEAGPDALPEFEKMLGQNQKELSDLLKLGNRHPAERGDAERFVAEFFETSDSARRTVLIGYLCNLLK
jgi:hypothetical protein